MSVNTRHTTKLTYNDYVHFPNDGNRHEIIDGVHYMAPSPTSGHQDASRHIQFQLYRDIEERGLGRVYNAPMDLQLSETDVVEILSPATTERDRTLKLKLYEQRSVPEYWIVDPNGHAVTRYRLGGDGTYSLVETYTDEVTYAVPPAEGRSEAAEARVDLKKVWT